MMKEKKKALLSGNEAVARGAYEAGVEIAAAYPGTPSTEIMENIATYDEMYAEWSVNEKVAFEVAYGAAISGRRALAAMKHVGVNVAADALMTSAYTGANAGFVLVVADDPGMHSSQNEQDSRFYGRFAQIPVLEPSDSEEARIMTKLAFDISEEFDTPVLVRMCTRICHGKSVVHLEDRQEQEPRKYAKEPKKYVMVPAHARGRHEVLKDRVSKLKKYTETCPVNKIENGTQDIGIITGSASYQYAKEVFPDASFLKIGLAYPLPLDTIRSFIDSHKTVYVIEELEPYIEDQLKAAGMHVIGKDLLPDTGEYSPTLLREKLTDQQAALDKSQPGGLPGRPPVMCAGCPHRAVFAMLRKLKAVVSGDIGCYTLSTLPPLNTMDSCLCMGASLGLAQGMGRALTGRKAGRVVGVLGDSTFIHSGIPSLVNAVYNKAPVTIVILDNRITAMTGHQENPGTGKTLKGDDATEFDFAAVSKAIGAGYVATVDPIDIKATEKALSEAMDFEGASVVVAKRPCALVDRGQFTGVMRIDPDKCNMCQRCLLVGCPSISQQDSLLRIDPDMCFGCSLCMQVCTHDAIERVNR